MKISTPESFKVSLEDLVREAVEGRKPKSKMDKYRVEWYPKDPPKNRPVVQKSFRSRIIRTDGV